MILNFDAQSYKLFKTLTFKEDQKTKQFKLFYSDGKQFDWFDMEFYGGTFEEEKTGEFKLLKKWIQENKKPGVVKSAKAKVKLPKGVYLDDLPDDVVYDLLTGAIKFDEIKDGV